MYPLVLHIPARAFEPLGVGNWKYMPTWARGSLEPAVGAAVRRTLSTNYTRNEEVSDRHAVWFEKYGALSTRRNARHFGLVCK
jgi:hypothetical protein